MTLQTELAAVTEHVRRQAPAAFAAIEASNTALAATGLPQRALRSGQTMPDFELPDATGKIVRSADLRARGPLVISFYRGHWCPYCNLELRALQQHLPEIARRSATLVAISPQTPDQSLTTREKHELAFPVLSDQGNRVARQFGLVFTLDDVIKPVLSGFGVDLSAYNGDRSDELPVPATYVVAKSGVVIDASVDVDFRNRIAPETVLAWLDRAR